MKPQVNARYYVSEARGLPIAHGDSIALTRTFVLMVPGDGSRLGCQVDDCWGCGRYRCGCCVASCEKAYTAVFNNRQVSPIMKE